MLAISTLIGYSPERKNWEEHDATIFRSITPKYKKLCGVRARSTLFLSVFWNFDRGNSSKSKIWHHQLVRRYRINLELNLLRFLTKFPYSNGRKTSKNAPKIGQKTVFCDFDRGNSVLLSPNHFKSILWSTIGLGKFIRSVWCTEQKIAVRASTRWPPAPYHHIFVHLNVSFFVCFFAS